MKKYIGDEVYVEKVDGALLLTVESGGEDGNQVEDSIYLYPETLDALLEFVDEVYDDL